MEEEEVTVIDYAESLRLISGIGEKTVKDIQRIYPEEGDLVSALQQDKVPLYDNIVWKLRRFYNL